MNPRAWYRSKMYVPGYQERRSNSPWTKAGAPQRILIIRFHAIGDVALTLPSCLSMRRQYPDAHIDFLASPEAALLLRTVHLFDEVLPFEQPPGKVAAVKELLSVSSRLRQKHYQVVLDLQRNWKSRWIRRAVHPEAWGEFDRFGREAACDRTLRVFHDAGFRSLSPQFEHQLGEDALRRAEAQLRSRGWEQGQQLIVFNPAGLWTSRNWPLENYAQLARLWPDRDEARFVLLGTERLRGASEFLAARLGNRLVDLTGQTSPGEALAILHHVDIVVTEDSGLMHMAWALGKPLVALFGSSRHYWSLPTGNHVRAFHSGDLPCGACMLPECKYGDTRCLARVTPEAVLKAVESLTNDHRNEARQV